MKRLEERDNMAMFISYIGKNERPVIKGWHINEPVPYVKGCVVTFQADGDELDYLQKCIKEVGYDKATGELFAFYKDIKKGG
jgi:hypothetical protein